MATADGSDYVEETLAECDQMKQKLESETDTSSKADDATQENQKDSSLQLANPTLLNFATFLFIRGMNYTDKFILTANVDNIRMFNDIIYRFKVKNVPYFNTYFIKATSEEDFSFNFIEAFFCYDVMRKKVGEDALFNSCDIFNFIVLIDNMTTINHFHLHAYLEQSSEDTGAGKICLLTFNFQFINTVIRDTVILQQNIKLLQKVKQELMYGELTFATNILSKLRKMLELEMLQEMLLPQHYQDFEHLTLFLGKFITLLEMKIDWQAFLLKLRIYAPEITKDTSLSKELKQELGHIYDFPILAVDNIIIKLISEIRKLFTVKQYPYYVTQDNAQFWIDILREHAHDAFSSVQNNNLSDLSLIKFKNKFVNILKSAIEKHQVTHIVPPLGKSKKLSVCKVIQSLSTTTYFLIDDNVLKLRKREVMVLWTVSNIAVLIIEDDYWDPLLEIMFLKTNPQKKLIVVSIDCSQTEMLANHFDQMYVRFEDVLDVDQLNERLYFKKKYFKIEKVPMYKILKKRENMRALASQEMFEELLNEEKCKRIQNGSTRNIESYTILRLHFVQKEVVSERGNIFGIKGNLNKLDHLKNYIRKYNEVTAAESLYSTVIYDKKNFIELCTKHNNVHWLQPKENHLLWLESKGNIDSIRKHIIKDAPTYYTINKEYCRNNEPPGRIILIIDDQDTGILDYVANCMKKFIPEYFIISIKLYDYITELDDPNIAIKEVIIKGAGMHTEFRRMLCMFGLNRTEKAEVFLNACGNLMSLHFEKMIEYTKELLSKTKVRKVWISSGENHRDMLERSLSTLAFTVVPHSDQEILNIQSLKIERDFAETDSKSTKSMHSTEVANNGKNTEIESDPTLIQPDDADSHFRSSSQLVEVKYEGITCNASLLHVACQSGDLNQVRQLVLQQLVDINALDSTFKQTPIMWAARSGKEEVIDFLIQKSAKVALYDKNGVSAIHLAAISGDIGAVRSLMCAGDMDINTVDILKRTPLMWAVGQGDLNMVKYFIKNGASSLCRDSCKSNLLMLAAESGNVPMIEFLLNRRETQAIINCGNSMKKTPLMLAVQKGFHVGVSMLLRHGSKVNLQDCKGQTALHIAVRKNDIKMLQILLKWCPESCISISDKKGKTLLHLAARRGSMSVFNCLDNYNSDHLNCNAQTKIWKNLPLHYAARGGYLEIAKWLIEHESLMNASDRKGNSPLHMASLAGHSTIVLLLIHNGADINQCNRKMQTPVHIAAMNDHAHILEILWLYGGNVHIFDATKHTPLSWAQQNKCKSVLNILK